MNRSTHIANIQQTIFHDRRSHYAADLARSPEQLALGDIGLAIGTDRINQRRSIAVRWILAHSNKDAAVDEDRCGNERATRKDTGSRKPARVFRVAVKSPYFLTRRRIVGTQPAISAAEEY